MVNDVLKKVKIIIIIIIILLFIFILYVDFNNLLYKYGIHLNYVFWSSVITITLSVYGTYYYTSKNNEKTLEEQKKQSEIKLKLEKEKLEILQNTEKRRINREQIDMIRKSLNIVYQRTLYIYQLANYTSKFFSDTPQYVTTELNLVIKLNNKFLSKIRNDFSYDSDLLILIDNIQSVFEKGDDKANINMYFDNINNLCNFIGLGDLKEKSNKLSSKNAISKIYDVCFFYKNSYPTEVYRICIFYFFSKQENIKIFDYSKIYDENDEIIKLISNDNINDKVSNIKNWEDIISFYNNIGTEKNEGGFKNEFIENFYKTTIMDGSINSYENYIFNDMYI